MEAQELISKWRYFNEKTNSSERIYFFEGNEFRRYKGFLEWHYAYRNDGVFREEGDLITIYLQGFSQSKSSYVIEPQSESSETLQESRIKEVLVTDKSGEPLEGAMISVNGVEAIGQTDVEGRFIIEQDEKLSEISVFFLGFQGLKASLSETCKCVSILKVLLSENTQDKEDKEVGKRVLQRKEKDGRKYLIDLKSRKKYYLISEY